MDGHNQFRPDGFGVEINQFQELLAHGMIRRAQERGIDLPLFTVENMVPKDVRIRRLTPLLSRSRLRFKAGSKALSFWSSNYETSNAANTKMAPTRSRSHGAWPARR